MSLDLAKQFERVLDKPQELALIGDIARDISQSLIDAEDGVNSFKSLLAKLLGEAILQNFVEDDGLPREKLSDLNSLTQLYAELFQNFSKDEDFNRRCSEFGGLFSELLRQKRSLSIKLINGLPFYENTEESTFLMKSTSDLPPVFLDSDILLSNPEICIQVLDEFGTIVREAVERHSVTKLCFLEKRKGPIGTLLYVTYFLQKLNLPSFVYRTAYFDKLSRIKGAPISADDRVGIIYDTANSGGGLAEAVSSLKEDYNAETAFCAVLYDFQIGAKTLLKEEYNAELITLFNPENIATFKYSKDNEPNYEMTSDEVTPTDEREQKVFFRLESPEQDQEITHLLFGNKIEHETYPDSDGLIYKLTRRAFDYLRHQGYELETVKVGNIGDLPLEERNNIKRYHRKQVAARRDKTVADFLKKYGV